MKKYPSIPHFSKKFLGGEREFYGFRKYDGSNIRGEWTLKRGFHKFGTRKQLINPSDPVFSQAIPYLRESSEVEDMRDRLLWYVPR